MSAYGLLGLSQGLNAGVADQQASVRQAQLDALNTSVVNQHLADDEAAQQRTAGLYPGQLALQQSNLGLVSARTNQANAAAAAAKQNAADTAALQPTKVLQAQAQLGATKAAAAAAQARTATSYANLSKQDMNTLRGARAGMVQVMGTQLGKPNPDTKAIEESYNENLPSSMASKRIKPGSLQLNSQTGAFTFQTNSGHTISGTYAGLKGGITAPQGSAKGTPMTPSQTVTASTQWTNTTKGLISSAFGAGFNSNGTYNPGQDPALASKLTGIAASVGERIGYQNIAAGVVANAVIQANKEFGGSKNGITGDGTSNPNFMARVQQLIQVGSAARQQQTAGPGGIPTQAPTQPNLGANPQPPQPPQPAQPTQQTQAPLYQDGTYLRGPGGKIYIVQNGQPVLAPNQ